MIEETIYDYLINDEAISAKVSDRIYSLKAPQGTSPPYLVYQIITAPRDYTHDGYSSTRTRLQITIYSTEAKESKTIKAILYTEMEAMHLTKDVCPVMQTNSLDLYDDKLGLFQVPVDFLIFHKQEDES
jgi:hypothetical protein